MTEQKRPGEIPSLIKDVAKAREEEKRAEEAITSMYQLLDQVIGQRTQRMSNQFRHMLSHPSDDPRLVKFILEPELTDLDVPLTLVVETDGNPYTHSGGIRYEVQLREGRKERMVVLPNQAYFESLPQGMDEDPRFDRQASFEEIIAYQELVGFAHSNIPLPNSQS